MTLTNRKTAATASPEPESTTTPATVIDVSQIVVLLTSLLAEQRQLSVRLADVELAQSNSSKAQGQLAAELRSDPGIQRVAAGMMEEAGRTISKLVQRTERLEAIVRDQGAYIERLGFTINEVAEIVRAGNQGSARAVADQIVHDLDRRLANTNALVQQATTAVRQEAESTRKAVRQQAAAVGA